MKAHIGEVLDAAQLRADAEGSDATNCCAAFITISDNGGLSKRHVRAIRILGISVDEVARMAVAVCDALNKLEIPK